MQNKTTIQINGRIYDAKSGVLLRDENSAPHAPAAQHRTTPAIHHPPKKQFVDGFVRGTPLPGAPTPHALQRRTTAQTHPHGQSPAAQTAHPTHAAPKHHIAADATSIHQKQHKSATLMRKAVKHPADTKPAHTHTIQPKRGVPVQSIHGDVAVSARSRLAEKPREKLIVKAHEVPKSETISHFTPNKFGLSDEQLQPLPVKLKTIPLKTPAPESLAHHSHQIETPAHHNQSTTVQTDTATPKPRNHRTHAMLQRGLMAANSHEQHRLAYKKSTRRTLLSVGAGTLAAIILTGYIAYVNIPNIAMRVAASKAGFSASLPENPSGYAMKGPIKYAPGKITFSLRSNSSDNTVAITEQTSNWDSQTLLKNHVRPAASGEYEAVEASGRTLYMYNKTVTWVHGGVWYQIDGNDQLGRDQMIKLATSM